MPTGIETAFMKFGAFDFGPLERLSNATGQYHYIRDQTERQIAAILAPLRQRAIAVMRPHSISWSGSAGFSMGRDPLPALSGSIMPNAERGAFYGNYPTIHFSCLVKTPDEFAAFWRAMRVTADALAGSEIFKREASNA